jgi:hypothetical protein
VCAPREFKGEPELGEGAVMAEAPYVDAGRRQIAWRKREPSPRDDVGARINQWPDSLEEPRRDELAEPSGTPVGPNTETPGDLSAGCKSITREPAEHDSITLGEFARRAPRSRFLSCSSQR